MVVQGKIAYGTKYKRQSIGIYSMYSLLERKQEDLMVPKIA